MSNLTRKRTLTINNKVLDYYIDNKQEIPKGQLSHLKAIQDRQKHFNQYETTYKYLIDKKNKDCSIASLGEGRIYGEIGSPEYLDTQYRNNLFADYYWDIDMKNCHPTLMSQYAKKFNLSMPNLESYVINRDEWLVQLQIYYKDVKNIDYSTRDVKDKMIALLYNANIPELKNISNEIHNLFNLCKDSHPTLWKTILKIKNHSENREGSFMSFVIQSIEVKCLEAIDTYFLSNNRSIDSLAYDGLMVRKLPNENEFDEELLKQAAKYVLEKTGYDIKLVIKPMVKDINDTLLNTKEDKEEIDYKEMKKLFERNHFFLKSMNCICRLDEKENIIYYKLTNSTILFAEWELPSKKKFISKWLLDRNKRCYERLVCNPKKNQREDEFNIFKDFIGSKARGTNQKGLEIVFLLINILVNFDEKCFQYVCNWIALMIQKPWINPLVCLVFVGPQGVGKETLWNWIGIYLIGCWVNITDADRDLYGQFAMAMNGTFFQKLEEANPASNRANQDKFKSLVTSNKTTINPKGLPCYEIDIHPHIVSTGNRNAFVVEDGDRRLMINWCSSMYKGNTGFWDEVYEELSKESTVASAWKYFSELDIENFKSTNIPMTSYKNDLIHDEKRTSVVFLENWTALKELTTSELYREYETYCFDNNLTKITDRKFYRDITEMVQRKIINTRMKDGYKLISKEHTPENKID
jgi:hypothetical protein